MKNIHALGMLLAMFAVAFVAPSFASAQSPFDGAWRADDSQTTFSSDAKMIVLLQDGIFDCKFSPGCVPEVRVKADGTDQPVSGNSNVDTLNVRQVGQNSIENTMKKNGKTVSDQTETVSDDGNTLTSKSISYPPNSSTPLNTVVTLKRIAPAPSGASKISGTWQPMTRQDSENGLTFTLKSNGDGLDSTNGAGASSSAKFDGKDYPVAGATGNVTVSLKRIDDHTFESTTKANGKTSGIRTFAVSSDGKKMTDVVKNPQNGATITYILYKQ